MTTEPRTDYPILVDGAGRRFVKVPVEDFVKMEAEAAQGAAPLATKLADAIEAWTDADGDWSQVQVHIATIRRLSEGAAPRAEGLDARDYVEGRCWSCNQPIRYFLDEDGTPQDIVGAVLDAERLRDAIEWHSLHDHESWDMEGCHSGCAGAILKALSRPSDEVKP